MIFNPQSFYLILDSNKFREWKYHFQFIFYWRSTQVTQHKYRRKSGHLIKWMNTGKRRMGTWAIWFGNGGDHPLHSSSRMHQSQRLWRHGMCRPRLLRLSCTRRAYTNSYATIIIINYNESFLPRHIDSKEDKARIFGYNSITLKQTYLEIECISYCYNSYIYHFLVISQ